MSTLAVEAQPRAERVFFSDDDMTVVLVDGRKITVPLAWFPSLAGADRRQLESFELLGDGEGLHWPALDEDISVKGLLRG